MRVFRRSAIYEGTARLDTRGLALELSARMVGALVVFKAFLSETVEGERGYGALETRSGNAPRAVGAAPAGEVVGVDPDQAFVHTSTWCVWFCVE